MHGPGVRHRRHDDGRPARIVVIEKDDQSKPDVGKSRARRGLRRRQGRHRGRHRPARASALAMLPVAEEYKKILLVEPAVADSITGDKWNRYIFRTGRNSHAGRDRQRRRARQAGRRRSPRWRRTTPSAATACKAFKDALAKISAKVVHEEYVPQATTDFTAPAQRMFDALKDKPGRKIIVHHLGRRRNPLAKIADLEARALRHRARHRRQHPAGDGGLQGLRRHGRRDLLLLRHPEEPGERLAGGRALQAVQGAARLLHRRRHERGASRWSRR